MTIGGIDMKTAIVLVLAVVLILALAVPAFAVTGADGAGRAFGEHHSTHARLMGGFTGSENPGDHRGFAGWVPE